MFFGPASFNNISQRIHILIPIKTIEITNAVKDIKLEVDYDTKR
jgi:hypothetical protein